MIHVRDLTVSVNGDTICQPPPFEVGNGQRVQVVGANGSGKTTLLRVMAGLTSPTHGECRIDAGKRQRVYVHQSPYLFRGGVLSNVTYGLASCGAPRRERASIANYWLQKLGVADLVGRSCRGLSGGEQRRIALARAFAMQPKLLLLDEPFAELDSNGAALLTAALDELKDSTIVIATPSGTETEYRRIELR